MFEISKASDIGRSLEMVVGKFRKCGPRQSHAIALIDNKATTAENQTKITNKLNNNNKLPT